MAIAVGQKVKGVFSGSSGTTAAITTAATGSVIVRLMEWDNTLNFTSITDSKSNTYTQISVERTISTIKGRAYYKENATGGASHTFSGAVSSSANISLYVLEITGALTSGALDQSNSQTDAASPFTSPSITTTQAAELIWAGLIGNSATTPATHAESTGFTIQNDVTTGGPDWTGCDASKIVASTGTYNSSFTENGGSSACVFIASFKESGGGGGAVKRNNLMLLGMNR